MFKESLVKISLDKDFEHLFEHIEAPHLSKNEVKKFIEVSEEVKSICSWLEESDERKGMAYLPFSSTPKLLHLFHQKVDNVVIIVT